MNGQQTQLRLNATDARRGVAETTGDSRLHLQRAFDLCVRKSRRTIKALADEPKSAAWALDGNYFAFPEGFFEIGNWTSSFFTGMALIAWQQTEDEYFLDQVLRLAPVYREKARVRFMDMHHDAGFLYSLYSVALFTLTGASEHRETGLAAAHALAQRFNSRGNFIRAWGRLDSTEYEDMAIIDCLMNLPLLHWAAKESGNKTFSEIAMRHAEMALSGFLRPDHSVNHAVRFDLQTGRILGPDNACGFSTDSHWARGAAWAIYGFALSYRWTGDQRFLEAAIQVARAFVAQLDSEVVPVWDFRLPGGHPRVRDASAAAIAICGLQELEKHNVSDEVITCAKRVMLNRICAPNGYLDFDENCLGVLKSAYGDKPAYSSWGDYFLMEALARELFAFQPWW